MLVRVPLDEQQEAHLALILDLHKQDMAQIDGMKQQAEARKNARISPLRKALGIPETMNINIDKPAADQPCVFTYEDVERTLTLEPPRTESGSRTEKSTALAGEGR